MILHAIKQAVKKVCPDFIKKRRNTTSFSYGDIRRKKR